MSVVFFFIYHNKCMMTSIYIKVFTHSLAISLLFGVILLFYNVGKPYKRGFFCNDQTLSYPFRKSTVSSVVLYSVCSVVALCTILFSEIMLILANRNRSHNHTFKLFIARVYGGALTFVNGVLITHIITDTAKYSIGRLRPHFFQLCQPIGYSDYCHPNSTAYIENYECKPTYSGSDASYVLKNVHLSFMSGHSSFAAFCSTFAIIYLITTTSHRTYYLLPLKSVFATAIACGSMFIAYSRITDYKHHWEDVAVGYAQGSLVAFLIWYFTDYILTTTIITDSHTIEK